MDPQQLTDLGGKDPGAVVDSATDVADIGSQDSGGDSTPVTQDSTTGPTDAGTTSEPQGVAPRSEEKPYALTEQSLQYGDSTSLMTFDIVPIGGASFDFQIASDSDWVSLYPPSGTVAGAAQTIEVRIDREALEVGTHLAQLTVQVGDVFQDQVFAVAYQPQTPTVMSDDEIAAALRELPPLRKVHYGSALPRYLYDYEIHPLLEQYVRITHSLSLGTGPQLRHYRLLFDLVKRLEAENPDQPPIRLAYTYAPWHQVFPPDSPPTDFGPDHDAEIDLFRERLEHIRDSVAQANSEIGTNVQVAVFFLDSERFYARDPNDPNADIWNAAIDAKYNAFFGLVREYFPEANVDWYFRGGVHRCGSESGWCRFRHFTGNELGDSYAVSLYSPPEIRNMQEAFRITTENAEADGVPRVIPWITLASGYQRDATDRFKFTFDWDYNLWYSWQMGAELNIPWYGDHPDRFAPWHWAEYVYFYPEPFGRVPHWGKHFVAYVRGAAGMDLNE